MFANWCIHLPVFIFKAEIQLRGGESLHKSSMSQSSGEFEGSQIALKIDQTDKLPDIHIKAHKRLTKAKSKRLLIKTKTAPEIIDEFVPQPTTRSPQRGDVIKMRQTFSSGNIKPPVPLNEQLELLKASRSRFEMMLEEIIKQKFSEIVQRRSLSVAANSKNR
jgi:hypothetical protein